MSHARSRFLLVGLVGAVLAASTIGTAQAHTNDPAAAHSASLRTPRGDIGAGRRVLIYAPTLAKNVPINERKVALRLGFRVKVATKTEWSAMTEEDFSSFSSIVFGDPACKRTTKRLDAAIANQAIWSAAVDGNVVVGTFDVVWHANFGKGKHGPPRAADRQLAQVLRSRRGHGAQRESQLLLHRRGPRNPGGPARWRRSFHRGKRPRQLQQSPGPRPGPPAPPPPLCRAVVALELLGALVARRRSGWVRHRGDAEDR